MNSLLRSPGFYSVSIAILMIATRAAASDPLINPPGVPLVDSSTLVDWTLEGTREASFRFDGEVLVGQPTAALVGTSFLCSPRSYYDFELSLSFRLVPQTLNSGVQFRSAVNADGRVAGPQLEIEMMDPSEQSFYMRWLVPKLIAFTDNPWRPRYYASGGIYGEGLPWGWLYPGLRGGDPEQFQAAGKRLLRRDGEGWNDLRLKADGPRVQTWLNGVERADYEDDETDRAGKICFQVHAGEYVDPSAVRVEWRDLLIRERDNRSPVEVD